MAGHTPFKAVPSRVQWHDTCIVCQLNLARSRTDSCRLFYSNYHSRQSVLGKVGITNVHCMIVLGLVAPEYTCTKAKAFYGRIRVVAGAPQVMYSSSPYTIPGAASISAMPMTSYTTATPMPYSALESPKLLKLQVRCRLIMQSIDSFFRKSLGAFALSQVAWTTPRASGLLRVKLCLPALS